MTTVPPSLSPTTPPPPSTPDDETLKTFIDDPEADIILRSCDSQEFHVLKLYIIRSSPVLGRQIQLMQAISDPSQPAISTDAGPLLPVLQLSDNGAILSTLLTFIFPLPAVLPPTLEETMELLSVAQKYEMVSVLACIRGCISLKHPPLICPETAFRAFSLAQKLGLRHEAAQAARITLTFALNLEDKLDAMPGVYLHELWKYHQSVQRNLLSAVNNFRESAAGGTLTGLTCVNLTRRRTPEWLDDYIASIAQTPSYFDIMEFQTTLASHVSTDGCKQCLSVPRQAMHTFWTALTNFINENIAEASVVNMSFCDSCNNNVQAESSLSILGLGCETRSQDHIYPPDIPSLPDSLSISEADIIIQSSDSVKFRVHKLILASASQLFKDMFSLPQPPNEIVDGLHVLHMSEDAELVRALITMLYPIPSEIPVTYDRALSLLAACQKYDMPAVQSSIRAEISYRKLMPQTGEEAFRAYAIASRNRLSPETSIAAHLTLDYPMTFEYIGSELHEFEGWALQDLVTFRRSRQDDVISCFESFLDVDNGPSIIWIGRPTSSLSSTSFSGRTRTGMKSRERCQERILPSWLSNLFTEQIAKLKTFTNPLIRPLDIREKCLAALRSHAIGRDPRLVRDSASAESEFYLHVHFSKGEEYFTRLEEKLALARDKVSSAFAL